MVFFKDYLSRSVFMEVFPSQLIDLKVQTAMALCFARSLMYSSIAILKLKQNKCIIKIQGMNRQFRLSLKSGKTNHDKSKQKSYRELKTALERRKAPSSYQEFRIPKNVALEKNRESPILHQNLSSGSQNQKELLTRSMERIKIPKTQRTMAEQKLSMKEKKINQYYIKERQEHTNGHWSSFSRKNVQFLSKKMKNIRLSNYASNKNQEIMNDSIKEHQRLGNLVESFVCKSLEPQLTGFQKASVKNNYIHLQQQNQSAEANRFYSFHKEKDKPDLMVLNTKILKQKPASAMSNQFHTKLKKKCIENNPHILASIIKKKQQILSKQDLYYFVQKMIQKSKNQP